MRVVWQALTSVGFVNTFVRVKHRADKCEKHRSTIKLNRNDVFVYTNFAYMDVLAKLGQ